MPLSRGPTTMSSFHDRMDDVMDWAANHFIQKGKADSFVTWSSSITNRRHQPRDDQQRARAKLAGLRACEALGITPPDTRFRWGVTSWILPLSRRIRQKLRPPRFQDPFDDSGGEDEVEVEHEVEHEVEVEDEVDHEGREGGRGGGLPEVVHHPPLQIA